jgi:ankyrin repeat protein
VPDGYGRESSLVTAVSYNSEEAILWLISHGANIEGIDNGKSATPLTIAARKGNYKTAKLLIDHGANIHAEYPLKTGSKTVKMNALKWALANGFADIAELLRSHGAILPEEAPQEAPSNNIIIDSLLSYLELKFGTAHPLAFLEVIPSEYSVAVHVFPPNNDHSSYAERVNEFETLTCLV